MFEMIRENEERYITHIILKTNLSNIFENEQSIHVLAENAEGFISTIQKQVTRGENPFTNNPDGLKILAGLFILSNDSHRQAFNLSNVKTKKLIDLVGDNPKANEFLIGISTHGKMLVNQLKNEFDGIQTFTPQQIQTLSKKLDSLKQSFKQISTTTGNWDNNNVNGMPKNAQASQASQAV